MSTNDTPVKSAHDLAALVPEDRRGVAEALADELEFMTKTLADLKAHIGGHGAVEWYENGKQKHWRESPAMKSYNAMIPRYAALYKQLVGLLPTEVAEAGDELDEWLRANS